MSFISSLLMILYISAFFPASISANEPSRAVTEQLDNIICQFLVEQNVPGATLAVAKHGHIVYEQGEMTEQPLGIYFHSVI